MKRNEQDFIPVDNIQPNSTYTTLSSQRLGTAFQNFIGVFHSYSKFCLQKERKETSKISYLQTISSPISPKLSYLLNGLVQHFEILQVYFVAIIDYVYKKKLKETSKISYLQRISNQIPSRLPYLHNNLTRHFVTSQVYFVAIIDHVYKRN